MATRTTRRDQRQEDAPAPDRRAEDQRDEGEAGMVGDPREQSAQAEVGEQEAPSGIGQELGRALQEQIEQALQPAVEEFRQQMAQVVRQQTDQTLQPEGARRQREAQPSPDEGARREQEPRPSPEASREEGQPTAEPTHREAQPRARQSEPEPQPPGGEHMATRASQADRRQDAETARDQRAEMEQPEERETGEEEQGEQRQLARADQRRPAPRRRPEPGEVFDARAATRVGLLRLARNWRETGSAYQAIHAYTEVLVRYPGTGAASAAAEELVGLAEALEREGRFYTALNIFNKLEQLL